MGKKGIILVVDDEEIVRESLRDWLVDVGYRVEVAESGEAALEIIKRKKVKVMLADLVMPGLDGIELMKEASRIAPTIITVIITAYGSIQTAISAIREGAYDYIEKPFCPKKSSFSSRIWWPIKTWLRKIFPCGRKLKIATSLKESSPRAR